ncbi:MAG: LysR family transcriptional regulator [Acidobacteriota bacterium]|nr:LysR family transcriptional regulator [Acidobacteriota bacterium]
MTRLVCIGVPVHQRRGASGMEIHQLRYFCAVVECGSFTKAAKQANVSQPSLSQQIIKLELELGIKLFDRFHGQVGLTSAGETFLVKAQSILKDIADVTHEIQDNNGVEKGKISFGVSPHISPDFLPNRLARFSREHAQVGVRVVEEVTSLLIEYLRDGLIDLALVVLPLGHAVAGKDLSCVELTREPLYAVLPNKHRLAAKRSIALKDLHGEQFVFLKDGRCYSENVASAFRRAKLHPNVVAESSSSAHVLAMTCSGVGVSVVPEHALDSRREDCRFVPISGENAYSEIGLVQLNGKPQSRAQQSFATFLEKSIAQKSTQRVITISA